MRFGLLVVLALVALVPSLTDGRIVSRCELKEKLEEAITLPRRYERFREKVMDRILARVICSVEVLSQLNTDKFRVIGRRRTTTARPTASANVTTAVITSRRPTAPTTTRQTPPATTTTRQTTPAPTTTRQTTPAPTTTGQASPAPTTTGQTPTGSTTSQPDQTPGSSRRKRAAESPIDSDMTGDSQEEEDEQGMDDFDEEELESADNQMEDNEEEEEEEEGEGEMTSEEGGERKKRSLRRRVLRRLKHSGRKTSQPDQTPGNSGRKRATESPIDSDMTGDSQEEEDEQGMDDFDEEELESADNQMEDDEEEEEEEEEEDEMTSEDGGERKKRSLQRRSRGKSRGRSQGRNRGRPRARGSRKMRPWSLGFYGLFQLRDSYFCNSGYRYSRNVCNMSCDAFTDEDITNDIQCLVKSRYWWFLFRNLPRSCRIHTRTRDQARDFFSECY